MTDDRPISNGHDGQRNEIDTRDAIAPSILSCIGNTPLVQLNHIPKAFNVQSQIVAKCEFFNAGGSIKDRIGLQMILDAEKEGQIRPGDTLIGAPASCVKCCLY
jgi:cysteine synthase